MAKYRSHGQIDDPVTKDGDIGFLGIDQLRDSSQLEAGRYQYGENIRIVGGKVKTRDGLVAHNYYSKTSQESLYSDKVTLKMVEYSSPLVPAPSGFSELVGFTGVRTLGKIGFAPLAEGLPRSDYSLPYDFCTSWEQFPSFVEFGSNIIQAKDDIIVFPAWQTGQRPCHLNPTTAATVFNPLPQTTSQDIIGCPRAPFGIYYQNRLIVPRYEVSPTTTIISDILSYQFALTNEFNANRGYSDITLGYAPMPEDQLLVLNKNSIHVISGITNGGERISEITRQHGIAGHSAYANNGSYVYFVSSEGNLEVLVPQLDPAKGLGVAVTKMNLDSQPLSDMVNDFMQRVNLEAIDTCVVHYAKNLVYFALPIDGSRLANAILIYDSLHSAFVGVDTFNHVPENADTIGQDDVHKLLIHDIKTHKHQVWLSTNLGLFKYDATQNTDAGWEISTKLKTRDYLAQSASVKKFTKGVINYSSDPKADIDPRSPIAIGSKIKILSTPINPAYQGGGSGWLQVGEEYEVVGYDETIVYEVLLVNPENPSSRVGLELSERGVAYDLTRECLFEVRTNTTSPSVKDQLVKSVGIEAGVSESLSSFNISRRGQTVNVEVSANSPIQVDNIAVEGFVANARTVGEYA